MDIVLKNTKKEACLGPPPVAEACPKQGSFLLGRLLLFFLGEQSTYTRERACLRTEESETNE